MTDKEFVLDTMRETGRARAGGFRAQAIAEALDGTTVIANEKLVPQWRQGVYGEDTAGAPVSYGDQVYKVWQAHDSTGQPDWTPALAVSLFDIYHTTDPSKAKPYVAPQGARGVYSTGEVCVYNGVTYRSVIDNNSWTPDGYLAGWKTV